MNEAPDLRNWVTLQKGELVVPAHLVKSVGQARFVPLLEMTREDWKLFDWESISNNGKNDIVAMALKEPIVGFVHYIFVTKGTKAGGYYAPVPASSAGNLEPLLGAPQFKHFGRNEEPLSDPAKVIDKDISRLYTAGIGMPVTGFISVLFKHMMKGWKARPEGVDKTTESQFSNWLNDVNDLDELDVIMTYVLSTIWYTKVEGLQDWVDEAEQILGDAEDKGLI